MLRDCSANRPAQNGLTTGTGGAPQLRHDGPEASFRIPRAVAALQPSFDRFPPQLQATAAALRATPAGAHALKCYDSYRFATLGPGGQLQKAFAQEGAKKPKVLFRTGGPRNNAVALGAAAVALVGLPSALAWWGTRRRKQ